ncbi:hypothetical protein [Kribbella sp. VKM Ac-2568]|uniref:hypothetical protein n=1 Tax=Kribbella sp. VKM Ac-2568 TaxID=2512219 RepID=UPI001045661C|nr:hypothetical protein [Kribbella sp. VKM Ac-2568]TCM51588.1 hypothetical protein EV648_101425 [Kribbella sp. VKM Ac-2568]
MSDLLPDEELPRQLDAAEQALAISQHRWFGRVTLLTALAAGVTLLLPWTFSRRLGLSVWQLGLETQPSVAFTWLAGLLTSILALALHPRRQPASSSDDPARATASSRDDQTRTTASIYSQTAAAVTALIAMLFIAGAWQTRDLGSLSDSWAGPGPALAAITGFTWLLAASAQLVASRVHQTRPTDEALQEAVTRLRNTR